ncbi:D-alanine--D-alanine ligase [Rhodocytophaga rosea]|uniref:D-alanine--D-alanine ligase n=1 Tax=Rhodocytophaga rosea TaxID=2704465 RepID=A0A6C0GLV5_9BACT|nr:D-alanine--D-alanine ligase [Rhodocytophaga rosea]QHT68623.1 D-alanine--D-alanine ligase [Rhodocytophaga rosea]
MQRSFWLRLSKWEFLPFWLFYFPVYFYWLWLGIRARSLVFFSAANPLMEMGGFCGYSKSNVLKHLPGKFIPQTQILELTADNVSTVAHTIEENFLFPLIVKPDVGERGWKVEKIHTKEELILYLSQNQGKLIVQEYIDYPLEFGVMYSRLPGQAKGKITSMVQKEFLSVVGDGKSTLAELFHHSKRTRYYEDTLLHLYKDELHIILPEHKKKELVSIGNHCRGTTFLNANHLITPDLLSVFDQISKQISGFYFGRYDLRVPSLEDLYAGKNIKILELNGANSEPAHIYDPQMSIVSAYKHLFSHWNNLFEISIRNHKEGIPFMSFREGLDTIRNRKLYNK